LACVAQGTAQTAEFSGVRQFTVRDIADTMPATAWCLWLANVVPTAQKEPRMHRSFPSTTREAFRVLNALRVAKLAVSLGGTESLVEHPASMTHADVSPSAQRASGITPAMIRLSVGVEAPDDLCDDLGHALAEITSSARSRPLSLPHNLPRRARRAGRRRSS
jgi:hypothetical protein